MAHFVYPVAASAQPATAYPAQTAYVAAAPAQQAYSTAAAPRTGQAYESYPTAHATTQYAYTTRTPVAVTPTVTYDQTKAYYQAAPAATAYTAAETHYQAERWLPAAKPVFTTGAAGFTAPRPAAPQPKVPTVQVTSASQSYAYSAPTNNAYTAAYSTPTTTQSAISGYDVAVHSAAPSYYQHQAARAIGTWAVKKPVHTFRPKPKGPPKTPQLHYCDICKISCAGPQTYREHLEGQKHKKKEAAAKGPLVPPSRGAHIQLKCDLCDVTCTGADAYAAHIRGAKHQKVVKLHTKLGKPIPSTTPVIMSSSSTTTSHPKTTTGSSTASGTIGNKTTAKTTATTAAATASTVKKVAATPKITFAGGLAQKNTTGGKAGEVKTIIGETTVKASDLIQTSADEVKEEEHLNILGEKDVAPVGHEYIEEMRNDQDKVVSFNCKLCECKFNDPNAKEMHLKGRRHRLQYKKKVDPNLHVEVKPSIRQRKMQEDRLHRQAQKEEFWRRRGQDERWRDEMRMEEQMYWEQQHHRYDMEFYPRGPMGMGGLRPPFMGPGSGPVMRKPESSEDRHVNAKHAAIYPTEEELNAVQTIVSACERSLKLVSDFLAVSDGPKPDVKKEIPQNEEKAGSDSKQPEKEETGSQSSRMLKGVMRVGVLAKGLLLHGDLNVQLVVLCAEKPTRTLLERVADCLPKQLAMATEKYEVRRCVEEAAIVVTAEKEPKPSCIITLTSPIMRDANSPDGETVSVKDPPDVLDRQKCLAALAALRRAKWFQARATGLPSCVVVIRILRELCRRVPTWSHLNQWALELLVEKCVSSGGPSMNPGEALRRVFECVSSGLILPGGPGIYDPCEKEPTDALAPMTSQMREDLVASAQHALRLIAFRQIHKVLAMEPLPLPRHLRQRFTSPRKRRNTDSVDGTDESAVKKEKKDDKGVAESGAAKK